MLIVIGSLLALYAVFCFSVWKVATYLCLNKSWLAIIPIVNLVYFCYVADDLIREAKSCEKSYSTVACFGLIVAVMVFFGLSRVLSFLAIDIALLISVIALFITLSYAYACFISEGLDHAVVILLATIVVPFPIFLLWASFSIPTKVEEVLELYL